MIIIERKRGEMKVVDIDNFFSPLTGVGVLIFLALLWIAVVFIRFRFGDLSPESASILVGIGGAFATLSLAAGIFHQASQNKQIIEDSEKERLIHQESDWIPHFYPTWEYKTLACSGPKPWYPWFKADADNKSETNWIDVNSYPVTDNAPIPPQVEDVSEFFEFDWFILFPGTIMEYFKESVLKGGTSGRLYFKFETMTGEWYFFIYDFQMQSSGAEGFRILETTKVERYLPWQDSEFRDELEEELEREMEGQD